MKNWLFEKDEQGISIAMCIIVIGGLLLIMGLAGGIERGLIMR
ncbi:hypothetical protein [Jeotgalibaca porci]